MPQQTAPILCLIFLLIASGCNPAGKAWDEAAARGSIDGYQEFLLAFPNSPEARSAFDSLRIAVESIAIRNQDAISSRTIWMIVGTPLPMSSLSAHALNNLGYVVATQAWRDKEEQSFATRIFQEAAGRSYTSEVGKYATCMLVTARSGATSIEAMTTRL